MRQSLGEANETELIEVFDALDVCVTYTKPTRRLELAATATPELVASHETNARPRGRSRNCDIAGAGFEPAANPSSTSMSTPSTASCARRALSIGSLSVRPNSDILQLP